MALFGVRCPHWSRQELLLHKEHAAASPASPSGDFGLCSSTQNGMLGMADTTTDGSEVPGGDSQLLVMLWTLGWETTSSS